MRLFSFDTQAPKYTSSCVAQRFFAYELTKLIEQESQNRTFKTVLDLGCGSGELYNALREQGIRFDTYIGCDLSAAMIANFPSSPQTTLLNLNFDDCLKETYPIDLICSSSALQWATHLPSTLKLIASKSHNVALSIMTDNTFKSFHCFLDSHSPLPKLKNMEESLFDFFDGKMQIMQKTLKFDDTSSLIAHLRNTGVMGGGILRYTKAKKILKYQGVLEYESILFVGKSKIYKGR